MNALERRVEENRIRRLTRADKLELRQLGISVGGVESCADFPVIAENRGNLDYSGIHHGEDGNVILSRLNEPLGFAVDRATHGFIWQLDEPLEESVHEFTAHWAHRDINDAILGITPTPEALAERDPFFEDPRVLAARIAFVLDDFEGMQAERGADEAKFATVIRGAKRPKVGGDFLDVVYPVGGRVDTTKITSTTTRLDVARTFASADDDYYCVIRTRNALPIAWLSHRPAECEALIAPANVLRCVHTDPHGIDGKPTVYLVAEDLVAEKQAAQNSPLPSVRTT